ncbi:MAG: hypothetical protein NC252_08125 [Roseburia sp.]|nr:hypothetical protein [Roseburia sp.]MCM1421133.1 hypothetical protein [Bacteroides sp.]MCM1511096.1 hypothetical protein [Clostridium sp.]
MSVPTYKYIQRLIGRITASSQSNNDSFTYYRHFVELHSGTNGYVSVTLYKTESRYDGELADFSFDYWTLELHFVSTVGKAITENIINAFRHLYAPRKIQVSYDEREYEDEDTTYEYDKTDWDKPPVKRLNK